MPENNSKEVAQNNAVEIYIGKEVALADNADWTNRFRVTSETSSNMYTIAQHKNKKHWGCNCKGWLAHRKCKHLEELGLPGHETPYEPRIERGS